MSWEAWLVLVCLVGVVASAATERVRTAVAMGGGLLVLFVTGAIDDATALSGLSSPATATIALLYVAAGGIAATGATAWLVERLIFGRGEQRGGVVRLASATSAMSAFMPNTPLVAFAAPQVVRSSRARGFSASRLLMPLSFASILGGVITMLGTSTNLVVSDALRQAGDDPLGVFEITPVGLLVAVAGIVVLMIATPLLLRERTAAGDAMRDAARTFQLQMLVESGGPLVGRTVEAAGLRHLEGLYLAAVERAGQIVTVRPETLLSADDRLYFVGDITRVVDLQHTAGLVSAEQGHVIETEAPGARLYEAVVGVRSDLVGHTLRSVGFRARHGAAVLAIHRRDEELRGKLGTIPLATGDVLLVLASPDFASRWREHGDFSLVASVDEPPPPRRAKAGIAVAAFVAMVVLAATGVLSLFAAAAVAAATMVVGRVLSPSEARHAVDVNVVLTIAFSISMGNAAVATGLASEMATRLVDVAGSWGDVGLVLAIVVTTQMLTEVISNSGAAAIMVPIALGAASAVGADPRGFAIAVLVGASCSFLTPIGYQTNLMVYSLGGYRFTDFTRLGLPLTITCAAVTSLAVGL